MSYQKNHSQETLPMASLSVGSMAYGIIYLDHLAGTSHIMSKSSFYLILPLMSCILTVTCNATF